MSTGPEGRVMRVTPSGALVPCDACDLGIGPGASPPHTCGRSFPERANREGDQALPAAGQQDVFEHVIGMLRARQAVGIKRYGRSLQTFNGRDASRDLVEELLDAVVYADQAKLEREELQRRLHDAQAEIQQLRARLGTT